MWNGDRETLTGNPYPSIQSEARTGTVDIGLDPQQRQGPALARSTLAWPKVHFHSRQCTYTGVFGLPPDRAHCQ